MKINNIVNEKVFYTLFSYGCDQSLLFIAIFLARIAIVSRRRCSRFQVLLVPERSGRISTCLCGRCGEDLNGITPYKNCTCGNCAMSYHS